MDVEKEEGLLTQEQREKTNEGAQRSSEEDKEEPEARAAAEESVRRLRVRLRQASVTACTRGCHSVPLGDSAWLGAVVNMYL